MRDGGERVPSRSGPAARAARSPLAHLGRRLSSVTIVAPCMTRRSSRYVVTASFAPPSTSPLACTLDAVPAAAEATQTLIMIRRCIGDVVTASFAQPSTSPLACTLDAVPAAAEATQTLIMIRRCIGDVVTTSFAQPSTSPLDCILNSIPSDRRLGTFRQRVSAIAICTSGVMLWRTR